MLKQKNINAFIDFNYTPFNIAQSIKRLLAIWGMGILLCFIGSIKISWLCIILFFNLLISIIFLIIIFKFSKSKSSRFICDGITCLYISILLNLASYKILAWQLGSNLILALIFTGLLLFSISVNLILAFYNIKTDKYNSESCNNSLLFTSFGGAVLGIIVAKQLSHNISNNGAVLIISIALLLLSFLISIGSINLLKLLFFIRQRNEVRDS